MTAIVRHTHQTFDPKKVDEIARQMREEDPDWTYKVKHDPSGRGRSLIEVYDEDGRFIHYF